MSAGDDWQAANQRHLSAALAVLAATIEDAPSGEAEAELHAAAGAMPAPPALDALAAGFGLSPFGRDVVLLCAGPELDASFPASAPTFGLALAKLPGAHWTALGPGAPLRRWRLVEVGAGATLTADDLQTVMALQQAAIPVNVLLSKADLLSMQDRERIVTYVK